MPSPLIDAPPRWHPQIPAAAEVITGGTARLAVPAAGRSGPLVVVGAQPGDVVVVDVLAVTRADGASIGTREDGASVVRPGHPGTLGCASDDPRDAAGCAIAPLTAGSRVLLPVRVLGARLDVGGLHFPERGTCRPAAGSVELRVHLTRRGVERFAVSGPILMPDPSPIWR